MADGYRRGNPFFRAPRARNGAFANHIAFELRDGAMNYVEHSAGRSA